MFGVYALSVSTTMKLVTQLTILGF